MQTALVGSENVQSLPFIPAGDQPVLDNHSSEDAPHRVNQEGRQPVDRPFYFAAKRLLDLTLILLALGLLWPLLLLIAVAIKLDSPGPLFVTEERVGGRRRRRHHQVYWEQAHFPLYNFRTTALRAQPAARHKPGAAFGTGQSTGTSVHHPSNKAMAIDCDAVTNVGHFLRQTSLDQLPQLWNIFKGDLTLVGPRPVRPEELTKYVLSGFRRFETMAGMTGLWQLQQHSPAQRHYPRLAEWERQSALGFEQMVQLDLKYIEKQSLPTDVRILCDTFLHALRSYAK